MVSHFKYNRESVFLFMLISLAWHFLPVHSINPSKSVVDACSVCKCNLTVVDCSFKNLTTTDGFFFRLNTTSINLAYNSLENITPGIFDGLAEIRSIDLSHNKMRIIPDNLFGRPLTSLLTFDLSYNSILTLSSSTFNDTLSLVSLFLNNNQIMDIPDGAFLGLSNLNEKKGF